MALQWKIIDTGKNTAEENMAIDQRLLRDLAVDQRPVLRFYDWDKVSATYGYFFSPEKHLKENRSNSIALAKRPTGGGFLFHGIDCTFSVLIPAVHSSFTTNTVLNYQTVNLLVKKTLLHLFPHLTSLNLFNKSYSSDQTTIEDFCMAKPVIHDVMIGSKKVCGGAQRRKRHGFLHQGSIFLTYPSSKDLSELFADHTKIHNAFSLNSFPLLGPNTSQKLYQSIKCEIQNIFSRFIKQF